MLSNFFLAALGEGPDQAPETPHFNTKTVEVWKVVGSLAGCGVSTPSRNGRTREAYLRLALATS